MSDYAPAAIYIGGNLDAGLEEDFCRVIQESDVALRGQDVRFKPKNAEDLAVGASDDMFLELHSPQARHGQFDKLEEWLQEHGMSYDRETDSYAEHPAYFTRYRPGHDIDVQMANPCGDLMVRAADVQVVRDRLRQVRGIMNPATVNISVEDALRLLRDLLPPELPDLPPFLLGP